MLETLFERPLYLWGFILGAVLLYFPIRKEYVTHQIRKRTGGVRAPVLATNPLFGLSLTRDDSGSLAFGTFPQICFWATALVPTAPHVSPLTTDRIEGAIDGSVVMNRSLIEWNEVVPFAPFGDESNTSSYLQWTVVLEGASVRPEMNPLMHIWRQREPTCR